MDKGKARGTIVEQHTSLTVPKAVIYFLRLRIMVFQNLALLEVCCPTMHVNQAAAHRQGWLTECLDMNGIFEIQISYQWSVTFLYYQ